MNKEGWVKIFSSLELYKAQIAADILRQNNIISHIESKPDSAIPSLGEAILYTLPENVEEAVQVLKKNKLFDEKK